MDDPKKAAPEALGVNPAESSGQDKDNAPKSIDEIWKKATERIAAENQINIKQLELSGDFKDATTGVAKASKLFESSRHPKDKTTKVIQVVGGCLDWVDAAVGFAKDHVSGSFATPAQLVCGAISYMIQASRDMTEDFDLIVKTFETIHNALQDIGDLKERNIDGPSFMIRLMDVFISMFDFCTFSGKMFKKYSRKRLYIRALLKGRNEEITQRSAKVEGAILLFRANVPVQILRVVGHIDEKIDNLPVNFIQALRGMKLKESELKSLLGQNKALEKVIENLKRFDLNSETNRRIETQMELIKKHLVAGTFSWLVDDLGYKAWLKGQNTPFLYVSGPSGAGKTFFTFYCHQLLQQETVSKSTRSPTGAETNKGRQSISVASFLFEPGKQDSQSFQSVLAAILVQIADHDAKLCDSLAKDVEVFKPTNANQDVDEKLKFLWNSLLVKKFEKSSEASRLVYILLDGVELMDENDRQRMLNLFQTLNSDKSGIRILMTGTREIYEKISISLKLSLISLADQTKSANDINKIVDERIKGSENLKAFSPDTQTNIKRYLASSTRTMSSVDLTLTLMEQSGSDEKTALERMKKVDSPEGLYDAMFEIVRSKRSELGRKSVEMLFAWCAYSTRPFTVYELQHIAQLDPAMSELVVYTEIQGTSSRRDGGRAPYELLLTVGTSLLYTTRYKSPEDEVQQQETPSSYDNAAPEVAQNTDNNPSGTITVSESKHEYVLFRQPACREYLEKPGNEMIEQPTDAKVDILLRLCSILCDRDPIRSRSREALQEYATSNLVQHLRDIDIKATSPQQGRDVVEALSRVMMNENDVALVIEKVTNPLDFDLYDPFSTPRPNSSETAGVLLAWAKKMSFHEEEELSDKAREWVDATIQDPGKILEHLARGHLESWSQKVTAEDALIPCQLAYRILYTTGLFSDASWAYPELDSITPSVADKMIEFGREQCFDTPIKRARARTAAALLLNEKSRDADTRKIAAELYGKNLDEISTTPGPERFYSYLGLAEYHAEPNDGESDDDAKKRWREVLQYVDQALKQREDEKGALGSELNNKRCTSAFLLKAKALNKLDNDNLALDTCNAALEPGELEYSQQLLEFLTIAVDIYAKTEQYAQVIKEVQRQPSRVKSEWLWYRSDDLTDKSDTFRKAAVLTRRVDVVIQIFEEAIDYWQLTDPFKSKILQYELSIVYRRDARATKMAEHILDDIMDAVKKDPSQLRGGIVRIIFPGLVDIVAENYDVTPHKSTKARVIAKLSQRINELEPTAIVEPIIIARLIFKLAIMWRDFGEINQAKLEANRAFNFCIGDLEDSVGWNDSTALRLLAKILMFADLEVDARIALSLQFSEISKNYDDSPRRYDGEPPATEEDGGLTSNEHENVMQAASQNGNGNNPTSQDENSHGSDPVVAQHQEVAPREQPSIADSSAVDTLSKTLATGSDSTDGTSGQPSLTNGTNDSSPPEGLVKTDVDSLAPNGVSNEHADNTTAPPSGISSKNAPDMISESKPLQEAGSSTARSDDEDLLATSVSCDGHCQKASVTRWDPAEPYYYCLECYDVDLCSDCYPVQLNYYTDTKDGFWYKCCWSQHRFIQEPIEDWKGVKDGVIRIGSKSKPWNDWLEAVKDKWRRKMGTMDSITYT